MYKKILQKSAVLAGISCIFSSTADASAYQAGRPKEHVDFINDGTDGVGRTVTVYIQKTKDGTSVPTGFREHLVDDPDGKKLGKKEAMESSSKYSGPKLRK